MIISVQLCECWSSACGFMNAVHLGQTQCYGLEMGVSPVCPTVSTTGKFCGGSCISKRSLGNALALFLKCGVRKYGHV